MPLGQLVKNGLNRLQQSINNNEAEPDFLEK